MTMYAVGAVALLMVLGDQASDGVRCNMADSVVVTSGEMTRPVIVGKASDDQPTHGSRAKAHAGGLSPGRDFPVMPPTMGLALLRRRMLITSTTSEKAMAK